MLRLLRGGDGRNGFLGLGVDVALQKSQIEAAKKKRAVGTEQAQKYELLWDDWREILPLETNPVDKQNKIAASTRFVRIPIQEKCSLLKTGLCQDGVSPWPTAKHLTFYHGSPQICIPLILQFVSVAYTHLTLPTILLV